MTDLNNLKNTLKNAISKVLQISRKILRISWENPLLLFSLSFFFLTLFISLPFWPSQYKLNLAKLSQAGLSQTQTIPQSAASPNAQKILEQINPVQGYEIKASFGDIGPKLLASGVIDFEKMKELYKESGIPLTEEQIKILTQGSSEKIKVTPQNSYFLLNFLWAAGLANKNQILDQGPMTKEPDVPVDNFASTGGWTLGRKENGAEYYSRTEIIKLDKEQQKILEDFAFNSYRPCCGNPTGFPDCNHGMAALALGEIMASQGATADEIFEAFKYFNAFWFTETYFDIAVYFQAKENKDWKDVPGRIVAGKDFSTPQGWQGVRQWLTKNNLLEEAPSGAGGCGV